MQSTSENIEKMYDLKNVTYKGSYLPARVLLPMDFLTISLLSWGGSQGGGSLTMENDC